MAFVLLLCRVFVAFGATGPIPPTERVSRWRWLARIRPDVHSSHRPGARNNTHGGIVGTTEEDPMDIDEGVVAELQRRLRRIEGQVRGIQNMLAEERECRDVVTQIAAAAKALEQVGFRLLASGLASCLQDPEQSEAEGYPVSEVERLFLKLA